MYMRHDWDFAAKSLQANIPGAQGMWAFQLIGKAAKTKTANFNDWNYNRSNGGKALDRIFAAADR